MKSAELAREAIPSQFFLTRNSCGVLEVLPIDLSTVFAAYLSDLGDPVGFAVARPFGCWDWNSFFNC